MNKIINKTLLTLFFLCVSLLAMDIIFSAFVKCLSLLFSLDPYLIEVTSLTLGLSALSTAVSFALGVPAGLAAALSDFKARRFIVAVINAGMGLPPVVVGLVVALLLGRGGPFGAFGLLYTKTAIFISQLIIAFPVACGLTIAACGEVPESLKLQLESFGANLAQKSFYIAREIKKSLIVVAMATFGSVVSEVGAVIMVGGNLLGETRVLTTAIVSEVRVGNYDTALSFAIVLLALTFAINYATGLIAPQIKKGGA